MTCFGSEELSEEEKETCKGKTRKVKIRKEKYQPWMHLNHLTDGIFFRNGTAICFQENFLLGF